MELEVVDEFGEVVTGARVSLQVTLFIIITTLNVVLYHLEVLIDIKLLEYAIPAAAPPPEPKIRVLWC